jgi:hypothetical protein
LPAPILALRVAVRVLRVRVAEMPRDVLTGAARLTGWLSPLADTVCALAALFADLLCFLVFGAPHAVSASARLPMHVKNTIRFMIFPCMLSLYLGQQRGRIIQQRQRMGDDARGNVLAYLTLARWTKLRANVYVFGSESRGGTDWGIIQHS